MGATTYGPPLTAHSLSAFCLLPLALCLLAGSATDVATIADAFTLSHTFTFSNTAAEPAPVGRSDFISRIAVGSHACNCADGIWRDVVSLLTAGWRGSTAGARARSPLMVCQRVDVLALKADPSGVLWIGTENGAARLFNDKFETIKETAGKVITAIITPERDHAIMASEQGQIFDCRASSQGFTVRAIPAQPLQSADRDQPGL
jgi:hypothetical protein